MKKLSIILVSFNTQKLLKECIDSIYQNSTIASEIIVVDNNSHDGSPKMIREKYPEIQLIENQDNRGFAKAVNQGLQAANSKYILLLNSDTRVQKNSLEHTIDFIKKDPKVGVVGCKLQNSDGSRQNSFGNFPFIMAEFLHTSILYKFIPFGTYITKKYKKPKQVDWIAGSFQMFTQRMIQKTGVMDENYNMYLEDIDICYRAKEKGYKNYYLPSISILHHLSASTKGGGRTFLPVFLIARNTVYFALKHKGERLAKIIKTLNLTRLKIQEFRFRNNKEIKATYKKAHKELEKLSLEDINKPVDLQKTLSL